MLAAVLTAAVLALTPSWASAESKLHLDPAGDMGRVADDVSDPDAPPTPAPGRVESDITSIRVTHLTRNVRIALTFRALNRVGFVKMVDLRVISPRGVREATVTTNPRDWAGDHELLNGNGDTVRCPGLAHKLDYVRDRALVVIPRACLGNPRSVRVQGFVGTLYRDFSFFVDDAYGTDQWGDHPVTGPRVLVN
jgi:hypothetical protein